MILDFTSNIVGTRIHQQKCLPNGGRTDFVVFDHINLFELFVTGSVASEDDRVARGQSLNDERRRKCRIKTRQKQNHNNTEHFLVFFEEVVQRLESCKSLNDGDLCSK